MISNIAIIPLALAATALAGDPMSSVYGEFVEGGSSQQLLLAAKGDCIKACEAEYFKCGKRYGNDMKQCAEKRRACVSRCGGK